MKLLFLQKVDFSRYAINHIHPWRVLSEEWLLGTNYIFIKVWSSCPSKVVFGYFYSFVVIVVVNLAIPGAHKAKERATPIWALFQPLPNLKFPYMECDMCPSIVNLLGIYTMYPYLVSQEFGI